MAAAAATNGGGPLGALADGRPRWLAYGPSVRSDYMLMEVDAGLLEELQQHGAAFKSQPDGDAVICTASRTFDVKSVETTNLLMLLPPPKEEDEPDDAENMPPVEASQGGAGMQTQVARNETADARRRVMVTATADRHFELVETAPKMGLLAELLAEHPYSGDEPRDGGAELGYTFEELLERVPCSAEQLRAALGRGNAIQLAGRWRSVSQMHLSEVLQLLLLSAVEKDWPVFALPGSAAVAALEPEGYPAAIVLHCLRTFSEIQEGEGEEESDLLATAFALDKCKVCQSFARSLLQTSPRWAAEEFMTAWAGSVPTPELAPAEDMLRGIAIRCESAAGPFIQSFDAEAMPRSPVERFRMLFSVRPSWLYEELEPYLKIGLEAGNQSVEALLMKHARAVQKTPDDPVTYTAR